MGIIDWQFCDGFVKLFIERKKQKEIIECLIDEEDFELVSDYNWYAIYNKMVKDYYIMASWKNDYNKTESVFMHRLVTNCPDDMVVDHIDHKTTDNRKSQLRVCTSKENSQNRKIKFAGRITEEKFIDILLNNTLSDRQLANKYGVSQVLITNIKNGSVKSFLHPEIERREKQNQIKLTHSQVMEILKDNSLSYKELAKKYGVDSSHIQKIKTGQKRKNIYNAFLQEISA